ncbi:hypothetical protein GCM10010289_83750 [Streptomyces violascens]|uniref:Uncharacterized protein n=1 Tax=Streptomyces violascens TaxID=67381 RepID=A0ABQ3QSC4_9ACTN|nr:hypothetical protein GCM10010289_83750 [Streptomyces violascens]GHI40190.1 hypothetical protein Sviol_45980 [Streptomyces violascens]
MPACPQSGSVVLDMPPRKRSGATASMGNQEFAETRERRDTRGSWAHHEAGATVRAGRDRIPNAPSDR